MNGAFLAAPDGMPLVWLGRLHGNRNMTRVYGPDLMLAVCDAGRKTGASHYFYGGADGVAGELARALAARFPGLKVAGASMPPFHEHSDAEFAAFRAEISRTKPDFLWIGLGAPKQELFMAHHAAQLDAGLLLGVGAAFDFHSGRVAQAPRWMQRGGLEWLFRLCCEPRRLGRRYLITTPRLALLALLQLLARRKSTPVS
jgi:N-acetylglucosaminyldiphosphoundecaprenol N-acetyl-beta-D-mannosaminyltransferase